MPQITAEEIWKAKEDKLKKIQDGVLESHTPSVLFLGPSESGKSTIIKYLFELGGCQEEADSIEAGDEFCRKTRQTTYYNARLSFTDRRTRLSYENGPRELIKTGDETDFVFEGYFVDTPGLDCDEVRSCESLWNMLLIILLDWQ
jgi:ribosome biogenesis GTPase A